MADFPFPVKLVSLRKEDFQKNTGNGGGPKFFQEVTRDLREDLAGKVLEVSNAFRERFEKYPMVPSVAKVKLRTDAIAKSHRPTSLFSQSTCPIIGVAKSNELLIEVTPRGLTNLADKIVNTDANITKANITTLEGVIPYTPEDVISEELFPLFKQSQSRIIKIKLFDFHQHRLNVEANKLFSHHLKEFNSEIIKTIQYTKDLIVYKVACNNIDEVYEIANFGAMRSISHFPTISTYKTNPARVEEPDDVPVFLPSPGVEYPYVGVVDTGIRESHSHLGKWVVAREQFVLDNEKNCNHGAFVGGIVTYGERMKGNISPHDGVSLIDVCAIPNDDPKYGEVGQLTEDELIEILNEVIPKYSAKVKVWNLSLGSSSECQDESFSDLAIALDEIQDENDVTFVISAGNYEESPVRPWPPGNITYNDRLTAPGDSLRAVTVGSISHMDTELTKLFEPSPFSRRGPGPNYSIKPELVDFGGTITLNPPSKKGVPSFGEWGDVIEDIGTSFSTPKVSSTLAKIYHFLGGNPSRNLAKALLIHSAINPKSNSPSKRDEMKYIGYGQPKQIVDILNCSSSSSTFVFEGTLYPGTHVDIVDFPFPSSLIENNKCYGELFMTLVYDPPLNSKYEFEYCRSNIEVSLGTDKPTGYSSEVPLEKMGELEKELVENGFKWSPVKVYHRKLERGIADHQWNLKLFLQGRSAEILEPQNFALVITIKDPKGIKPIYHEVEQQLQQRFIFKDLQVSAQIRNTI